MVKYMVYRLFLEVMEENTNVFISGNSKKSMQIIDAVRGYSPDKVFFNWQDKKGYNIVLHYDGRVKTEGCIRQEGTLYILFGNSSSTEDMAYTLLSGYYSARSKANGSNSNILCL